MNEKYFKQIVMPAKNSVKGQNGRVLVIGGSELFHAASFWSACMAAKIVDMVHFSSPAFVNNELMKTRAKEKFWEGIVVPFEEVEHYIEEDDCILIGPGMERGEKTKSIVDMLLAKYPDKRWVVDGGALQEVDTRLLNKNMIVTPNLREQKALGDRPLGGACVLAKGEVDIVTCDGVREEVPGGTPAMTKGGTGDVLAGIVAGLYAKSPALASCMVASQVNKLAGENLANDYGQFYSASDLIVEVQKVLAVLIK